MNKAIDKWLPGYLASVRHRPRRTAGLRHLIFCVADHFEPLHGGTDAEQARIRVRDWTQTYAQTHESFRDADGRPPCHTFFFPAETYDTDCLDRLADFCRKGLGEVEIHLHHRNDTAAGLRASLTEFRDTLHTKHGLLGTDRDGRIQYGFVHGNWALCNARPDGDWCGVNRELAVLAETGCYADFTFPSAPSPTQPRMVNALYRAEDRADGGPRGHDRGIVCQVVNHPQPPRPTEANGRPQAPDATGTKECAGTARPETASNNDSTRLAPGLLLVQGPLALNWRRRKLGLFPRLENSEISGANPPTPQRLDVWTRQHIHVRGRPDWVFVKVHTHGCAPGNRAVAPDAEAWRQLHEDLATRYNDGIHWRLHYASARETVNLIRAAEDGQHGEPGRYRDYEILPP